MGPFKQQVTCIIAFFIPFNFLHFVNCTLQLPLCYSLNFSKKLQNDRKEDFCIYGCLSVLCYIKRGRKFDLQTQPNFQTHILFLFKCYIVTSDTLVGFFLDVLFLLLAVILSKLYEKPSISFIIFSMLYQIFLSPQAKRCAIITYKHGIYELPHELPNDLRLRTLANQKVSGNCRNSIE